MAVYCTWMISLLWMARWSMNGKSLSFDEMIEILYRFSREIEHSDVNLNRLEKLGEITAFLQPEVLMKLLMFA